MSSVSGFPSAAAAAKVTMASVTVAAAAAARCGSFDGGNRTGYNTLDGRSPTEAPVALWSGLLSDLDSSCPERLGRSVELGSGDGRRGADVEPRLRFFDNHLRLYKRFNVDPPRAAATATNTARSSGSGG